MMRTLSYVGQGWWSHGETRFKKAEDAIKIYGKDNVSRIGPGVWICSKNNNPVELLLMAREESPKKVVKAKAKAKAVAIPVTAPKAKAKAKSGQKATRAKKR
jgi:hypothetical protein